MAMAWLWTGMVAVSLVFGILTGSVGELGGAALEGATAAVELCVSMAGIMCLWTGVMEVMEQCGLSAALARLFRPLLRRLFPNASRDPETLAAISANLSANLLGLGNAATPAGVRADLTDPATWTKLDYPLQKSGMYNGEWQLGTGHGMWSHDEGGNLIYVFHNAEYDNGRYGGRDAQVRRVHWSGEGMPILDMQRDEELNPAYAGVTMEIAVR